MFILCYILLYLPIKIFCPTKIIGKKNLPKKQGYVLTCNHSSNFDPIVLDIYLHKKIRFLAKKELFSSKFKKWFFKSVGAFPVDREKPELSSYKFAINTIKDKKVLGIFPEGTRNKSDNLQLLELKSGAITFASKGETFIVPMVLYNRVKFFRRNYLNIGEPIKIIGEDPKRLTHDELEANMDRLARELKRLRAEIDEMLAKKKNKKARKKNEK